MKKNGIIVIIICTVVLLIGILTVHAQSNNKKLIVDSELGYTERSVFDEKKDGWVYGFEIIYADENQTINYIFDGYNLKHKPEGTEYYISYKDIETGEEIERIPSKYATLSTSEEYRDEIKEINNFFNTKKFVKEITLNDLARLNITKISKSYLVDLFNRTIKSQMKSEPGKYIKAPSLEYKTQKSSDANKPGEWQVMYIIDYGYINNIEIEFIPESNTKVTSFNSYSVQSQQDSVLVEQLENEIIEKQSTFSEELTESDSILTSNSDLSSLLDSIYNDILTK
ncbi:MAG: hypothetical protein IJ565_06110 [Bacilli bacterium]|nr:hypothetical protein [Bacilli bacterium]